MKRDGLESAVSKTLEVKCFSNYAIMTFRRSNIKIMLVYIVWNRRKNKSVYFFLMENNLCEFTKEKHSLLFLPGCWLQLVRHWGHSRSNPFPCSIRKWPPNTGNEQDEVIHSTTPFCGLKPDTEVIVIELCCLRSPVRLLPCVLPTSSGQWKSREVLVLLGCGIQY